MATIEQIYLVGFGEYEGKPYYVFVEKKDLIAVEADEIVVDLEKVRKSRFGKGEEKVKNGVAYR